MKDKSIQIKKANKVFKHKYFKMTGHDFLKIIDTIQNKISVAEASQLVHMHNTLEEKYGDYEVMIKVYPSRIKIINLKDY